MPGVVCRDNCRPDRIDVVLSDAATAEKVAGGVRAVDLETLVRAAVCRGQAHVVKHRPGVQELAIELEAMTLSGKRTPVVDAAGMVEQQSRFGILDELRYLAGEASVRNADSFDRERLLCQQCH
jgi:hypothetical protein